MEKRRLAVYARGSSSTEGPNPQEPDLRRWIKDHARGRETTWYTDSSADPTSSRPGLERLKQDLRAGQIGTVVVWQLSELGPTSGDLFDFLQQLDAGEVSFVSVREAYDTGRPHDRMIRAILAGFAEYERESPSYESS